MQTPGYAALRRHRWSTAGAEYFVTLAAVRPTTAFRQDEISTAIRRRMLEIDAAGMWLVRCSVVMPDHLHLLFVLGEGRRLDECIRTFKGPLAAMLRSPGARWQAGFYDHRMRPGEDRLPVFLYIYLNAYRARLVGRTEAWKGFWCSDDDWRWFRSLTESDLPPPAWLA